MRSGLSSEAAPDASLADLVSALRRHGLAAIELRAGDAHGISGALPEKALFEGMMLAADADVAISGYTDNGSDNEADLVMLSRVVRCLILVDGTRPFEERLERASRLREGGVHVAVVVRDDAAVMDARTSVALGLQVAWVADPSRGPVGGTASQLLSECGERLVHVRLLGGGPESVMHEGRGVGELMGRLALAGFEGAVILAPSSPRFHVAWATWLGRRGGFGCGSKASDDSLVTLG